jgi:hypothetical protein
MAGWDDLDAIPKVDTEEITTKRQDLDRLVQRVFSTEDGQKLLKWMREVYLENPSWQPGADNSYGYWREGQNAVVRDLEVRIRRALQ